MLRKINKSDDEPKAPYNIHRRTVVLEPEVHTIFIKYSKDCNDRKTQWRAQPTTWKINKLKKFTNFHHYFIIYDDYVYYRFKKRVRYQLSTRLIYQNARISNLEFTNSSKMNSNLQ